MSDKPKVKVVNDRYKIEGEFHKATQGTPFFDEEGVLCGYTTPRDMTYIHSLGGEGKFFQSLTKGMLFATRCDNPDCEQKGTMYLPFRIHCPDCLVKMTPVDVTDVANKGAKIHTFIITERSGAFNPLPKPIRFIDVEFPGIATFLKGYMSGPGEPDFGMRIVPIFNTKKSTYSILDLSWVKEGTKAEDLPDGFTFSLNA